MDRDVAAKHRRRNHSAFGSKRERQVAELLRAEGWEVAKTTAPAATYDLVALRANGWAPNLAGTPFDGYTAALIQVKGTARSPWVAWGPSERQALREAANRAGGTPLLAWWPPHGPLQWIGESEWPS